MYRSTKEILTSPPPLVVQLRLISPEPGPVDIAVTGLFRVVTIICLTFLFSSVYGGRLFSTLLSVLMFCSAIGVSRIASIAGTEWMARLNRLTIIECGNEAEMRGVERLLGSMPGVVIGRQRGWGSGKFWAGIRHSGGWPVDEHWKEDGWVMVPGLTGLQLILAMAHYFPAWVALSAVDFYMADYVPYGMFAAAFVLCMVGCEMIMQMRGQWGVFLVNDEEEEVP